MDLLKKLVKEFATSIKEVDKTEHQKPYSPVIGPFMLVGYE
tara:strand:+ start:820 stop:942 length:123 start_codon:yes stop_codon:yes gene_type:complete